MTNCKMTDASHALVSIARQAAYSTHRDTGYSAPTGWVPTVDGGAIVEYADDTCETFSAADLASAAE